MAHKDNKTEEWERLVVIIKQSSMSTNAFARHIGLPRGENLYQIKRGNNGISIDLADRICKKFPQINKLWLLTGEGKMLLSDVHVPVPISISFHGSRRDWLTGAALAGLLAGGCLYNTHLCANQIANDMESLLSVTDAERAAYTDNYYWFLGMAMIGLLAVRRETTTCQNIKKFADDMYALNSDIAEDISQTE